jgi:predicted S18 family serine protease
MALKITTQIGTNRGLTSEAYVRIGGYDLIKQQGSLILSLQVYQNESDANQPLGTTPLYKESVSLEIGSILRVPLLKDETIIVKKNMPVEETQTITVPVRDTEGNVTSTEEKEITRKVLKEMDVEEIIKVPDMSIIKGQDIFAFGYTKLNEHLAGLFGAENVVDC